MSEWVKLDIDRLDEPRRIRFAGQKVWSRPSPYDLPQAVRARWNTDHSNVIVEFDYLDDEGGRLVKTEHSWLRLEVGKHSGRILALLIDPKHFQPTPESRATLLRELERAFLRVKEKEPRPAIAKRTHYDITNSVLANHFSELAGTLGS